MPSVAEECREPSRKCRGISRCLESGHHVSYGKLAFSMDHKQLSNRNGMSD